MKTLLCLALVVFASAVTQAQMSYEAFTPIYKGVDLARGTNNPDVNNPRLQVVRCVRVDLTDPDVSLFPSPPATNGYETLSMSVSNHLVRNGLAVAVNANGYNGSVGGTSPPSEGIGCTVEGMLICTGRLVSAAEGASVASLLFSTNKTPSFALLNNAPGVVSTNGILNAVTGFYPILTNGVNLWINSSISNSLQATYTPGDNSIHTAQPRTVFGVSADKRYLFLMTIDGRQMNPPYSAGAYDGDSAAWMLAFGASDAINMDGGGSTSMYMADCSGNPVALNHSSYVGTVNPPHERYVGAHFGVFAQPLGAFIYNITATGAINTASVTWNTTSNATSQVEYGLTSSLGTFSAFDPTLVTAHSITLSNLAAGRTYYYRVWSSNAAGLPPSSCTLTFMTTNAPGSGPVLAYSLTNAWKWTSQNLDGANWMAASYPDSAWTVNLGTFWADSRGSAQVGLPQPLNTQLPLNPGNGGYPYTTYYFRTHFTYPGNPSGAVLTFSNYLDDGFAVYLNGVEVNRLLIPAGAVNATSASGAYCSGGNATCPYVFTVSGDLITNLHSGDNVIAVELHNVIGGTGTPSPDATFAQSLWFTAPAPSGPGAVITNLVVGPGETNATIIWQTLAAGNTQLQYGTNASLGLTTPLDSTLVTNHVVTLTNLLPLTTYYFRALSSDGGVPYSYDGTFTTIPFYQPIISISANWRYTTNNVSASNWTAVAYDDAAWPQGAGLLYVEDNTAVSPRTTVLPTDGASHVFPTYYFRTHFTISAPLPGYVLLLTNFIDDGAVFYVNGKEVQRVRMPAGAIGYASLASGSPADNGDATLEVPDIVRLSGDVLTNVVVGDNVLAVEVHQAVANDTDVVFGTSIGLSRALAAETRLRVARITTNAWTISWDGTGMTLQNAGTLRTNGTVWTDVTGPVKKSPFSITNTGVPMRYYRLRN